MKLYISNIESRFDVKTSKTDGILSYDADNAYPQRMKRLISSSGIAMSCVVLFSKFINGKGFSDINLYKSVINRWGETADSLLRKIILDYSYFGGCSIHFNYNLLGQVTDISYLPFEYTRLCIPDDNDYFSKIAVSNNWDNSHWDKSKKRKPTKIDVFNPKPDVVLSQIQSVGSIEQYNGQVLWFSNADNTYPKPLYDSVIEDIDTDASIKVFRNSNIRTGFSASHIFVHKGKFESDTQRQDMIDKLSDFQGIEQAGSIMLLEVESEEQIPQLIEVKSTINDKVISITNDNTKSAIIEAFGIPPILLGVQMSGSGGITFSNDAISLAYKFYNSVIENERIIFEELSKKIFTTKFPEFQDFRILPLEWENIKQTNLQ